MVNKKNETKLFSSIIDSLEANARAEMIVQLTQNNKFNVGFHFNEIGEKCAEDVAVLIIQLVSGHLNEYINIALDLWGDDQESKQFIEQIKNSIDNIHQRIKDKSAELIVRPSQVFNNGIKGST